MERHIQKRKQTIFDFIRDKNLITIKDKIAIDISKELLIGTELLKMKGKVNEP